MNDYDRGRADALDEAIAECEEYMASVRNLRGVRLARIFAIATSGADACADRIREIKKRTERCEEMKRWMGQGSRLTTHQMALDHVGAIQTPPTRSPVPPDASLVAGERAYPPFGLLLRALRATVNATIADMSEATGIGPAEISAYERGRQQPNAEWFLQAMEFFHVRGLYIPSDTLRQAWERGPSAPPVAGTEDA